MEEWRDADLLPVHSCAPTRSKSTQATRSGYSCDCLNSVHRAFELAGRSLWKLLCVAGGKMERRAMRRLYGLVKRTLVYVDTYSAFLLLTRSTGAALSTASDQTCSSAPRAIAKKGIKYPMYVTLYLYHLCRVSTRLDILPILLYALHFRRLVTTTLFTPATCRLFRCQTP